MRKVFVWSTSRVSACVMEKKCKCDPKSQMGSEWSRDQLWLGILRVKQRSLYLLARSNMISLFFLVEKGKLCCSVSCVWLCQQRSSAYEKLIIPFKIKLRAIHVHANLPTRLSDDSYLTSIRLSWFSNLRFALAQPWAKNTSRNAQNVEYHQQLHNKQKISWNVQGHFREIQKRALKSCFAKLTIIFCTGWFYLRRACLN